MNGPTIELCLKVMDEFSQKQPTLITCIEFSMMLHNEHNLLKEKIESLCDRINALEAERIR